MQPRNQFSDTHAEFLLGGNTCFVTGWGASNVTIKMNQYDYSYPTVLQSLAMKILDAQTCETKYFPGQISSHEFCAETKTLAKGICYVNHTHSVFKSCPSMVKLQDSICGCPFYIIQKFIASAFRNKISLQFLTGAS